MSRAAFEMCIKLFSDELSVAGDYSWLTREQQNATVSLLGTKRILDVSTQDAAVHASWGEMTVSILSDRVMQRLREEVI